MFLVSHYTITVCVHVSNNLDLPPHSVLGSDAVLCELDRLWPLPDSLSCV